jgi:hypothetical protein
MAAGFSSLLAALALTAAAEPGAAKRWLAA